MNRVKAILVRLWVLLRASAAAVALGFMEMLTSRRGRRGLALLALLAGGAACILKPPVRAVGPGEIGLRQNHLTGSVAAVGEGPVLVLPLLHELRRYSLREQIYRPVRSAKARGDAPFQSIEGLSIGVEASVRYALDPERIGQVAQRLPEDVGADLIEPVVDGVLHRALAAYTVREIFTAKRVQIQRDIELELRNTLLRDGVLVRAVYLGNVDLPEQYRAGLEGLLAEELETEKMRYTLELKQKRVREKELEAEAAKVQRQKAAEASALEEIIAAKGKAEAMKHVLPFKQKEIEQRRLEAEARGVMRVKEAESGAVARRIESGAEADARRKLSEAEAYHIEVTGKASSEQLARESVLIAHNPLLIQKTLADKLSDKISVIVAPPAAGGFFAANLLGGTRTAPPTGDAASATAKASQTEGGE